MTFDAWEVVLCPSQDYLMHWGVRGMKHGRRRYQNEDGTWTEAGLEARRKREGFGSKEERKAARKEARAQKSAAKSERKAARTEARKQAMSDWKETRRKNNVKTMTDEELAAKINRLKMETEYREMKKSPLMKAGMKFINDYFDNKKVQQERAYNEHIEDKRQKYEMKKMDKQMEQAKIRAEADKARADADKARADADKSRAETDKIDIEKGTRKMKLKNENRNLKLQGKFWRSNNTILGGLRKMANKSLEGTGEAVYTTQTYGAETAGSLREARKYNRAIKKANRYSKKNGLKLNNLVAPSYRNRPGRNNNGGGKK